MIFRLVQCGEIIKIALDLGALCNLEPHRVEQILDALKRTRDRMQTTGTSTAAGQRHIERLTGQLRFEFFPLYGGTTLRERSLQALLGGIKEHSHGGTLGSRHAAEAFLQICERTRLTQITGLHLLEFGRIVDAAEQFERFLDDIL